MRPGSASVFTALLMLVACDRHGQAEAPTGGILQPEEGVAAPLPKSASTRSDSPSRPAVATGSVAARPRPVEPEPPRIELTPEEPEHVVAPPAGYGWINPTEGVPDDEALTVHGLAGYEVVAIYDRPDTSAKSLGYLRIGTRLSVTTKVAGKGCRGSWHQLPQGGYACAGRGLVVDSKREPPLHTPATAPDKTASLPYGYAYVKQWNTPMYWRPPTAKEQEVAAARRSELEQERKRADEPAPEVVAVVPPPAEADPVGNDGDLGALPNPEGTSAAAPPPPVTTAKPESESESDVVAAAAPKPRPKLPLNPQTPWLERGFFVSIGEKIEHEGRKYWKTARGGFVEASAAYRYDTKGFEGHVLEEGVSFPMGFVMTPKGAKRFDFDEDGRLRATETLPHKTFVDLREEVEHGGQTYMMTTDGGLIRKAVIRFAQPQPLPEGLEAYDHWIDVGLDKQMLVAYEGTRPVFITLVSTGKKGSKEESFETPTGRWRIRSKHVSTTMDGQSASDGNYSIQDVPWTMYFHESFALHGAFWHDGFGRVRSHGCVNLGPADAKWLFDWTTPYLPEDWHGVHAHEGSLGTTVVVRR